LRERFRGVRGAGDASASARGRSDFPAVELLRKLLSRTLGLGGEKPEPALDELSLQGVSRFIQSDRCRDTASGAGDGNGAGNGERAAAGIPDFRSPGTGLYANLQSYDLPYPEAIFEIAFFKVTPHPTQKPHRSRPTVCHYFMRLLQDKGLLLRCYTQNIDTLERVAGLNPELLVEAHGTFYTSHCLRPSCQQRYDLTWMRERIFSSLVPKCDKCQGLVKPGEFVGGARREFRGVSTPPSSPVTSPRHQVTLGSPCPPRDVAWLGDCDTGCLALAELLGWKEELEELVRREHVAIDAKGDHGDSWHPRRRRGDEDKAGGSPGKSPGDETEVPRDPQKSP
ncbi:SIR2 deacetylase, partial [Drymodes brunneopygia]|nr:SIR2 deacetylase [Drymodes brunneopygia]